MSEMFEREVIIDLDKLKLIIEKKKGWKWIRGFVDIEDFDTVKVNVNTLFLNHKIFSDPKKYIDAHRESMKRLSKNLKHIFECTPYDNDEYIEKEAVEDLKRLESGYCHRIGFTILHEWLHILLIVEERKKRLKRVAGTQEFKKMYLEDESFVKPLSEKLFSIYLYADVILDKMYNSIKIPDESIGSEQCK